MASNYAAIISLLFIATSMGATDYNVSIASLSVGTGKPWQWTVFVDGTPDAISHVRCVQYTLDPSFPNPNRTICERGSQDRPFASGGDAWGPFNLSATVTFDDKRRQQLQYTLNPQAVSPDFFRSISVAADKHWTDTEFVVQKGEIISFAATGKIHWGRGADEVAGPDGDRSNLKAQLGSRVLYPIRGMGAGGLIARVDNGKPFKIGAIATTPMPNGGKLFLGINDTKFSNNSGAFSVAIKRSSQ